ncbi:hypothetical protein DFH11DRAFT_1157090 [Phellopilus nigrolimitatus]|nr:hypothetical protein DFH11DRAFT_1157090 [Phellopilus nigrolimitatus]
MAVHPAPPAAPLVEYPSPVQVIYHPHDSHRHDDDTEDVDDVEHEHRYEHDDLDDADTDDLESDYVDVDPEPDFIGAPPNTHGLNPYLGLGHRPRTLLRPPFVHRESTDVEFAQRHPPLAARRWGRVRALGLARGRAGTILRSLRGSFNRGAAAGGGMGRGRGRGAAPPFEFREPLPVPRSVRQQYSELAPTDAGADADEDVDVEEWNVEVHKSADGMLAPPPARPRRASLDTLRPITEQPHVHTRSRSVSHYSRSSSPLQRAHTVSSVQRPALPARSSSALSDSTDTLQGTTLAPHGGGGSAETGETTVVAHDPYLIPLPSSVPSSAPSTSFSPPSHRGSARTPLPPAPSTSKARLTTALAPALRALARLQRLPWIAEPYPTPGILTPLSPPQRVAADFLPLSSVRAASFPQSGAGQDLKTETSNGEGAASWYRPPAARRPSAKQVQRALRADAVRASGLGALYGYGGYGVAAARSYAQGRKQRQARPLGYMYAPPSASASASGSGRSYVQVPRPSAPTPAAAARSVSGSGSGSYAQSYGRPQTQMPGHAESYASYYTTSASAHPAAAPSQGQSQGQSGHRMYLPYPYAASSPPLPPLPGHTVSGSSGHSGSRYSGSGHSGSGSSRTRSGYSGSGGYSGYGTVVQGVPTTTVPVPVTYTYSYSYA